MIIIRIKYFYDISCKVFLFNSLLVITLVKGIKLKALYCFRIPDTKGIYDAVTITYDRKIVRNCSYALITFLSEMVSAVSVYMNIYITAELNLLRIFGSAKFKRIAVY